MPIVIRLLTDDDYDAVSALWNAAEQSRRALNPVDDTREGIARYLALVGVILTGHDGRRGLIHHLCVHPDCRRAGVAARLVAAAEEALRQEGIQKIFCLVFRDNDAGNAFWERQGYSLRTNLNYRNKSLNPAIPRGD